MAMFTRVDVDGSVRSDVAVCRESLELRPDGFKLSSCIDAHQCGGVQDFDLFGEVRCMLLSLFLLLHEASVFFFLGLDGALELFDLFEISPQRVN